jgi:hypothetical protein
MLRTFLSYTCVLRTFNSTGAVKSLLFSQYYRSYTTSNLFVDKKVLVQNFLQNNPELGKVCIINGPSSVGKTTLASYLCNFGFNKFSYDTTYFKLLFNYLLNSKSANIFTEAKGALIKEEDIKKIYFGYKVNKSKYNHSQLQILDKLKSQLDLIPNNLPELLDDRIYDAIWVDAQKLLAARQNVVVESVFDSEGMNTLKHSFKYYSPMFTVLLYASLEKNLNKCFLRNVNSYKNDLADYRHPLKIIDDYFNFYKFVQYSDISKTSKVLEKVNKASTIKVLKMVIEHEKLLVSWLYEETTTEYQKQMQHTLTTLEQLQHRLMLSTNEEILVVPIVEADYIINTNCLGEEAQDLLV